MISSLVCACVSKGWKIERQMDSLHCTVLPSHSVESATQFVKDLQEACTTVKVCV